MFNYSKKLIFGDDRLLEFKRSTTHGIARLWTQKAIPISDHRYWSEYLRVFDSSSDVFSLLGVADIRRALVAAPENVHTLIEVLILHLESLRDDPMLSPFPVKDDKKSRSMIPGTPGFKLGVPGVPGLGNSKGAQVEPSRDRVKELLNCCRILTRLLPVLMEGDHDAECTIEADGGIDPNVSLASDELERQLLWDRRRTLEREENTQFRVPLSQKDHAETVTATEDPFVIDDMDDIDEVVLSREASSSGAKAAPSDPLGATNNRSIDPVTADLAEEDGDLPPSLGERLIEIVIDFLFYSGITIPWTEELLQTPPAEAEGISRVNFAIWTSGIGSSVDLSGTETFHESNRITILRLLLVLISKSVYIPAHLHAKTENPALQYTVETLDRSVVLPLLCSLLNTIAKSTGTPGWIEGLVPNVIKPGNVKDRFAGITSGSSKEHEGSSVLVGLSLQIINVLLSYDSPQLSYPMDEMAAPHFAVPQRPPLATADSYASRDFPIARSTSDATHTRHQKPNIFRFYISRLHRVADFVCLWNGIAGILEHFIPSGNQIIPLSLQLPGNTADPASTVLHIPETLILLWSLIDHNPRFRNFVLDDVYRAPQLLCDLLYFTLANKDNLAQQGLVRLCVFMLQDISAERAFAINISKVGSYPKGKLPAKFAPSGGEGSAADLLVQSVYHFLGSTKGALASLYPPLIISLSNTGAFWRSLSVTSSARLVQLLSSFSNAAFLLADEGNPRLLFYMLEALTSLIQYQFSSNPNFAYALVGRSKPSIDKLANFTLRRGIAEIRRVRRGRESVNSRLAETAAASTRKECLVAAGPLSPGFPSPSSGPLFLAPTTAEPLEAALLPDDEKRQLAERDQVLAAAMQGATEGVQAFGLCDHPAPPKAECIPLAPSDRVRAKMRQTSNGTSTAFNQAPSVTEADALVESLTEDELYVAASTIGRNGFVATEEWVASWQRRLPLNTLEVALNYLVPKVEEFSASQTVANKQNADERVLAFLREQSLKGLLPDAPPISRPFQWNEHAAIWLQSYLWGVIYVTALLPLGIWTGTNARLFALKVQQDKVRRRSSVSGGGPAASAPVNALFSAGAMVSGAFGSAIGGLGGVLSSTPNAGTSAGISPSATTSRLERSNGRH
ncbi:hypothetical protein K437DRAFT_9733 [Tilletiaria anomala UBC 951]|uniref:Uncharacterized protein n=1 Tax=Tilletiaria anomala (strain ATCC 24038 / CBS 436.72 / UBC 951) TaxID=1037660 RepID=A0A066VCZ2_TILAU|nr:uncharacterized protein K437DRAFT_9733 [Tilletiaria anomala UBC 951]KDN39617.1 hypothetical protein K437DRAFT_9733 [Tilletiaria anomala UBC 951]